MTSPDDAPPLAPTSCPGLVGSASRWRGLRKLCGRVLLYLVVGGGLMALMVLAASTLLHSGVSPRQLQAQASAIRVWGAAMQSIVACAALLLWPRLVGVAIRRGLVPEHERQAVVRMRPRLAAFLTAYLGLVAFGPANLMSFARFLTHRLG